MTYLAKIKYLGTHFHGFQVQPGLRTVQGELNAALDLAFGLPCKVTGCSRTDAGVHANEFCVKVDCDGGTIPADKLPIAVSRFLPNDLSLFYAEECSEGFHPRYDVKEKEYLYRIINSRIYDPFEFGRAWFVARPITDEGIERMRDASKYIMGKKDFATFMAEGSDIVDTVRTVTNLSVEKNGDIIEIRICADGFLYNMVRIIVGTLTEVAFGRFDPDEMPDIIASKDRTRAGMTAPADGLYLNSVKY
jgi:tRNA pseudouridine38-40 synthase